MTNDQMLKQNNPVLWAVSYVQSNPGRPVHLRELCAQMHLNYSYFSRQFHQQTGKTFTDYVQGVQMQWPRVSCERAARAARSPSSWVI